MTPIIEDAEHPANMPVETQKDTFIDTQPTQLIRETQKDTFIDTQPTQLIREPPYPERLMLPKVVGQPQFNLLGEL